MQSSLGFDSVSSTLTVNAIPQGLGDVYSPQSLFPTIDESVPTNPQVFNRYSYVYNNPLRYTDPYGWWTISIPGIVFEGGAGGGVEVSIAFVIDGHGNACIVWSVGGGGYGGIAGSGGLQIQWTSADTIFDLEGWSSQSGGSTDVPNIYVGRAGFHTGIEYILGFNNQYHGININLGLGMGIGPLELHSVIMVTNMIWQYSLNDLIQGINDFIQDLSSLFQ